MALEQSVYTAGAFTHSLGAMESTRPVNRPVKHPHSREEADGPFMPSMEDSSPKGKTLQFSNLLHDAHSAPLPAAVVAAAAAASSAEPPAPPRRGGACERQLVLHGRPRFLAGRRHPHRLQLPCPAAAPAGPIVLLCRRLWESRLSEGRVLAAGAGLSEHLNGDPGHQVGPQQ